MITYNPVTKNGKFQVTDKLSGTTKTFTACDEGSAKWKMIVELGLNPVLPRVNGKPDFDTFNAKYQAVLDRMTVKVIRETECRNG
jgi:hypothetical protein